MRPEILEACSTFFGGAARLSADGQYLLNCLVDGRILPPIKIIAQASTTLSSILAPTEAIVTGIEQVIMPEVINATGVTAGVAATQLWPLPLSFAASVSIGLGVTAVFGVGAYIVINEREKELSRDLDDMREHLKKGVRQEAENAKTQESHGQELNDPMDIVAEEKGAHHKKRSTADKRAAEEVEQLIKNRGISPMKKRHLSPDHSKRAEEEKADILRRTKKDSGIRK